MCFYIDSRKPKKIAKRNIICYKTGWIDKEKFHPTFQGEYFFYEKNILQPHVTLTPRGYDNDEINQGYHSYINSENPSTEGTFVIPKGASYYENFLQYVSSRIIWVGKISFWERIKIRLGLWKTPSEKVSTN